MTLLFGLLVWVVVLVLRAFYSHIIEVKQYKNESLRLQRNKVYFELIKLKIEMRKFRIPDEDEDINPPSQPSGPPPEEPK